MGVGGGFLPVYKTNHINAFGGFQDGGNKVKINYLIIFYILTECIFLPLHVLLTYFLGVCVMSFQKGTPVTPVTPANVVQGLPDPWVSQITNTDTLAAVAQILQSPQGQQVSSPSVESLTDYLQFSLSFPFTNGNTARVTGKLHS